MTPVSGRSLPFPSIQVNETLATGSSIDVPLIGRHNKRGVARRQRRIFVVARPRQEGDPVTCGRGSEDTGAVQPGEGERRVRHRPEPETFTGASIRYARPLLGNR